MEPPRAVFDSSVWVSGLAYPVSVPGRAIDLARELTVRSLVSEPLIDQTRRALLGPRFGWSLHEMNEAEARMRGVSLLVAPTFTLAVIAAKESDNRILECAVAGDAACIVTGDRKHLLPLGAYRGIAILSPADCLARFDPAPR